MELIKSFGWLILIAFGFVLAFVVSWFSVGMMICFYKIYFKQTPVKKVEDIHIQECYKGHGLCDCPGACRENC